MEVKKHSNTCSKVHKRGVHIADGKFGEVVELPQPDPEKQQEKKRLTRPLIVTLRTAHTGPRMRPR